jgi:protein SCO1/2
MWRPIKARQPLLTMLLLVSTSPVCWAQAPRKEPPPRELEEVGVVEQLNAELPLELPFVDWRGRQVRLSDYFDGKRPVILTLNYSACPMLCSLQLTGLFDALKKMKWTMGEEYRMLTVSIDPKEVNEQAALARERYLRQYGRPAAAGGYDCLVGKEEHIKKLADTLGFKYRYVPETGEYAHAAVTFICTPGGRVSRYLYGVEYDPQTIRLSLAEASQGKVGSTMDKVLLFCFQYDASAGKYGPSALKLMRLGGIVTVLILAGVLIAFWRREPGLLQRAETQEDWQ